MKWDILFICLVAVVVVFVTVEESYKKQMNLREEVVKISIALRGLERGKLQPTPIPDMMEL